MALTFVLIVGFIAGIFIPQKVVLKVGLSLFVITLVGLIVSTFLSETYVWYFGVSAMAVGFITIYTLLGGFVASLIKRVFNKADSA